MERYDGTRPEAETRLQVLDDSEREAAAVQPGAIKFLERGVVPVLFNSVQAWASVSSNTIVRRSRERCDLYGSRRLALHNCSVAGAHETKATHQSCEFRTRLLSYIFGNKVTVACLKCHLLTAQEQMTSLREVEKGYRTVFHYACSNCLCEFELVEGGSKQLNEVIDTQLEATYGLLPVFNRPKDRRPVFTSVSTTSVNWNLSNRQKVTARLSDIKVTKSQVKDFSDFTLYQTELELSE